METKRLTVEAAEEILGLYFPVLDEGFVSLVDYLGSDASVIQAARTSYGQGTKKTSEDRGLIRYLRRHLHTTPSEMVEFKFHMKIPIFVARQLVRHRTVSLNEYSGRYSLMPMQFYTMSFEQFCKQSDTNKQGRGDQLIDKDYQDYLVRMGGLREWMEVHYEHALGLGLARELARIDLPLSMYTEWYWKVDMHNLFHFLTLRSDQHAQWETRQFSDTMAGMAKRVAPDSFQAWVDYNLCSVRFSRMEHELLLNMLDKGPNSFLPQGVTVEDIWTQAPYNLSKREVGEFRTKLSKLKEVPNFNLDLSKAMPPEFFAERARLATPQVDQDALKL